MGKQVKENDEQYWKIFHKVSDNWKNLLEQSSKTRISVADIIANKYKISYAVAADIAGSIALSIAIG